MAFENEVMVCRECKRLMAITVFNYLEEKPVKPECYESKSHHVERWKAPGPCPKCGATMRDHGFTGVCWD